METSFIYVSYEEATTTTSPGLSLASFDISEKPLSYDLKRKGLLPTETSLSLTSRVNSTPDLRTLRDVVKVPSPFAFDSMLLYEPYTRRRCE